MISFGYIFLIFFMFPKTFPGVRLLLHSLELYYRHSPTYKVQAKIIPKMYYQQQQFTFIGVMPNIDHAQPNCVKLLPCVQLAPDPLSVHTS